MADNSKPVRLGFVGIGGRGSYHLDCALGMEGVEVPALCEIDEARLKRAAGWVTESGRPGAKLYSGETDYERLCSEEQLDCVICATPWEFHAPVCLAANRNGKHAVSEVPIVLTIEEAWELVETYEKTGKWSTLGLEQVLLESGNGENLAVLNMVRQGLFGDVIHAESGYVHDLRKVKFPGGTEPWRLRHAIERNGNLYPDHPLNRIMPAMDINHGDRFASIVSMSSRAAALNEYAADTLGPEHELARKKMAQGDYNVSLIRSVDGKLVTLNFDTNTPHPRGVYRLQGSKAVYLQDRNLDGPFIYIDGRTPTEHTWEKATAYLDEYQHPLIKSYKPPLRPSLRGHGGGGQQHTPLTWHLLIQALRTGTTPYFDVYDSVTSSAVSALSERSVGNRSRRVEFPDFTRGKWKHRPPMTLG